MTEFLPTDNLYFFSIFSDKIFVKKLFMKAEDHLKARKIGWENFEIKHPNVCDCWYITNFFFFLKIRLKLII